ncbi:MAG: hypothetical protein K0S05_3117 [Agromyces sp.]|nr:hypothetical protein [Agromyces sp.]
MTGPRRGQDLLDAIDSSDIFVNTSIIEGYPLTVPEAQARGLPIAMYDLPWLALLKDNAGVTVVPQGDADALAAAVVAIAADPGRYEAMSRASVEAGERATAYDFALLYQQLISGALPAEFSPEPTLEDGRKALDLLIFFAEKSAAAPIPAARNGGAEQGRPRRRSQPRSLSGRFERRLTPVGHRVLGIAPWLRPAARRVKLALLPR